MWDVCTAEKAVDLIKDAKEAQVFRLFKIKEASDILMNFALDNFSEDNLSILIIQIHGNEM